MQITGKEAAKPRECGQTLAASKVRLPHPKLSKRLHDNSIATKVTAVGELGEGVLLYTGGRAGQRCAAGHGGGDWAKVGCRMPVQ